MSRSKFLSVVFMVAALTLMVGAESAQAQRRGRAGARRPVAAGRVAGRRAAVRRRALPARRSRFAARRGAFRRGPRFGRRGFRGRNSFGFSLVLPIGRAVAPAPVQTWVPGHYEIVQDTVIENCLPVLVQRQVYVPGHYEIL